MAKILALLAVVACVQASLYTEESAAGKNPIRKVVTMLQNMQKKVTQEGEKAADLHEKFLCYCKTSSSSLAASIDAAGTKTEELESEIKAATELKAQTEAALKDDQTSRADAKKTMSEATAMREKENAAFKSEQAEYEANIAALKGAMTSIEQGMAGSFLQTNTAQMLKKLASGGPIAPAMIDYDRKELLAFLSGTQSYAPASGEITGILKTMHDEMSASLKSLVKAENAAVDEYNGLIEAKTKEVSALTGSVEAKLEKVSSLGVSLATMKNDLGDTGNALLEDKKFLAELEKGCSTADADYAADQKMRTQELAALADTIKILNDDDALELFKKTLPGASSSFLEFQASSSQMRSRALAAIEQAQKAASSSERPRIDFISMVLRGKKIGFDKVIGMIDEMVATLKKEQGDDNSKKEYCNSQFDSSDDKKKSLEKAYKNVLTTIADTEEGIATTKDEIAKLTAGIKALDKSVADATAQRQAENTEFKSLKASDTAAKELLLFAKNRLNKFYNPKLYKAPKKQELSSEDRIVENMGSAAMLVQISAHKDFESLPPAPPVAEAYKKKSEETGGVMAMMDLLIQDLEKELTTAETAEKDAQADYEAFLKDSQEKRTDDSKTLTDKEAALGGMEADLLAAKDAKKSTAKELSATMKFISSLHAECDWLIQYFDVRKEARTSEIDALGKAKAVLSGADYSLMQASSKKYLRH